MLHLLGLLEDRAESTFHFDDAALRWLSLARLTLLNLTGGIEPEIRVTHACICEVGKAKNLRLQFLADGVQQLGECRIVRAFIRARAEAMLVSQPREIAVQSCKWATSNGSIQRWWR